MAVLSESQQELAKILEKRSVDMAVAPFLSSTLQMEGISDFAGYFTLKSYEEGVSSDILGQVGLGDNRIQVSRLRTAWELVRAETITRVLDAARGSGDKSIDWDAKPRIVSQGD